MDLTRARVVALTEMNKWGLVNDGWNFKYNSRKRALGVCKYTTKEIQLSRVITEHADDDKVLDTIRHEIAHALAGSAANHGPEWKRWARTVGCNPSRNGEVNKETREVLNTKIKYVMVCPKGLIVNTYYRKPNSNTLINLDQYYVKGRKTETKGKLEIVAYNPSVHVVRA